MEKAKVIWLDGAFVPWDEAKVHVLTHSLHYGVAAFEGIRSYETVDGKAAVFRLSDHLRRLADSCKMVRLVPPWSIEDLTAVTERLLIENGLLECYIRPIIAVGPGEMGVSQIQNPPVCSIAVYKWGHYLGKKAAESGCVARVVSTCRYHPNSMLIHAKLSGNYVNSVIATIEAKDFGADEAILLDPNGFVAEGSGENLFLVRDGVVHTPPLATVLGGITRASVIKIFGDLGRTVVERLISRDELYTADEVFFTGTAAEIAPVREVDRRTVGKGEPGPVTREVSDIYFRALRGAEPKYRHWLHIVDVAAGQAGSNGHSSGNSATEERPSDRRARGLRKIPR